MVHLAISMRTVPLALQRFFAIEINKMCFLPHLHSKIRFQPNANEQATTTNEIGNKTNGKPAKRASHPIGLGFGRMEKPQPA